MTIAPFTRWDINLSSEERNRLFNGTMDPTRREGVRSLGDQVREALIGCAERPTTLAERAAFLELAAVLTDAGAEQLRRFLR